MGKGQRFKETWGVPLESLRVSSPRVYSTVRAKLLWELSAQDWLPWGQLHREGCMLGFCPKALSLWLLVRRSGCPHLGYGQDSEVLSHLSAGNSGKWGGGHGGVPPESHTWGHVTGGSIVGWDHETLCGKEGGGEGRRLAGWRHGESTIESCCLKLLREWRHISVGRLLA